MPLTDTHIQYSSEYHERDPKKKTREWANVIVGALRREWTPIVDVAQVGKNRAILQAEQSLEDVKKGFKTGADFMQDNSWVAIAVMHRIAYILSAEFKKGAYSPNVEATDLTATAQRRRDKNLLRLRTMLEKPLSDINRRVGNPAERIDKNQFAGNVDKFEEMGLDSNNDTDVNFFMEKFHKLWHEVTSQRLVKSLLKYNKFYDHIEELVNDVLAAACVAYETYASPYTGEIKWVYLQPEVVKGVWGQERDGSDADCMGYEKNVTIRRFLELAGPNFSFDRDSDVLRDAINFKNNTSYLRVNQRGCWNFDGELREWVNVVSYSDMLTYTVGVGKMEFKSTDGEAQLRHNKSGFLFDIDYSEDTSRRVEYTRQVREYQSTYKTYFLATGASEQFLFRYGKLYHQISYGVDDEYSAYSIHVYKTTGKPAVQVAEPFIKIATAAFHKIAWGIYESMPSVEMLNYEALARLVTKLSPEAAAAVTNNEVGGDIAIAGVLDRVIQKYKYSLTRIYSSVDENGDQMGGDNRPHYREEGKVDPLAIGMIEILDWAEGQVSMRLGINPLRLAETPDPKDGYKKGVQAIKSSENATYYISDMIEHTMIHTATTSLNIAQDAVEVKSTPVYEFLSKLINEENLVTFKDLEKIPAHRYAIFVSIFNTQQDKEQLLQEAFVAFQQGQITYDQYLIVKNIDDPKDAGMTMAFYRMKQEQAKTQQAEAEHQRILQQQQQKADLEARNMQIDGQIKLQIEDKRGQYMVASYNDANAAALAKKKIDVDSNNQKVNEHAAAEIKVVEAKENAKHQASLPSSTAAISDQQPAAESASPV